MNQKELAKTFMMISISKNPLLSMFFYESISGLLGLNPDQLVKDDRSNTI